SLRIQVCLENTPRMSKDGTVCTSNSYSSQVLNSSCHGKISALAAAQANAHQHIAMAGKSAQTRRRRCGEDLLRYAAVSHRPGDECHARRVVADIGGRATGGKSSGHELSDHRRLGIAREPDLRAQPPII